MRIEEAFRLQASTCAQLGSPFLARLLALAADRLGTQGPVPERLRDWPGDASPAVDGAPLRLAGALHALALQGDEALAAVFPPHAVDDDTLWTTVEDAFARHPGHTLDWLGRTLQTNEVRRSAALIAAAHWLAARYGLPIRLSELGSAAGLNMGFDRYALDAGGLRLGPAAAALTLAPRWIGKPPTAGSLRIVERRGVDIDPVDPASPDGRLRLRAYLWPDQAERVALTEAAIAAGPAPVDRADAIDWLAGRLAPVPGQLHMVFHTILWRYLTPEAQARGERLLAGSGATADAPLARVAMETDGAAPGAALWVDLWPEGRRVTLGRIDLHGRWIDWQAP